MSEKVELNGDVKINVIVGNLGKTISLEELVEYLKKELKPKKNEAK